MVELGCRNKAHVVCGKGNSYTYVCM